MAELRIRISADDATRVGAQSAQRNIADVGDAAQDTAEGLDTATTSAGSLTDQLTQLGGPLGTVGDLLGGAGLAGIAGGAAIGLGAVVAQTIAANTELGRMAETSGLTVETLSALRFQADQSGISIETVGDAAKEVQLRLAEANSLGTGPAVDGLAILGLTLDDLAGKTPDQQFDTLAQAIARVEDPARRAFAASELFGGAGEELVPILSDMAGGLDAVIADAERFGAVVDEEMVAKSERASEAMAELQSFLGSAAQAATSFAVDVLEAFGLVDGAVDSHTETLRSLSDQLDRQRQAVERVTGAYVPNRAEINAVAEALGIRLSGALDVIIDRYGTFHEAQLAAIDTYQQQLDDIDANARAIEDSDRKYRDHTESAEQLTLQIRATSPAMQDAITDAHNLAAAQDAAAQSAFSLREQLFFAAQDQHAREHGSMQDAETLGRQGIILSGRPPAATPVRRPGRAPSTAPGGGRPGPRGPGGAPQDPFGGLRDQITQQQRAYDLGLIDYNTYYNFLTQAGQQVGDPLSDLGYRIASAIQRLDDHLQRIIDQEAAEDERQIAAQTPSTVIHVAGSVVTQDDLTDLIRDTTTHTADDPASNPLTA